VKIKTIYLTLVLLFVCYICSVFSCANVSVVAPTQPSSGIDVTTRIADDELGRGRFDLEVSSLFGLLIIILKLLDDTLKSRIKFSIYKKIILFLTILFGLLVMFAIVCIFVGYGNSKIFNVTGVFSVLTLFLVCFITLVAAADKSKTLNELELEKKINEFTFRGTSPLRIIAGDMDFLGNVYKQNIVNNKKNKKFRDITKSTQIKTIKDNKVEQIKIICKPPRENEAKARIGYLLHTFEHQITIKFFDINNIMETKIRGRIMGDGFRDEVVFIARRVNRRGVAKYEYSEYSANSLSGYLFVNLWEMLWKVCKEDQSIISDCKTTYDNRMR
jgi:hypothetical protein